jgi:Programmed cell death protein 2, C-terminal putative domain
VFEMQILPSLLHVLAVDKYAPPVTTGTNIAGARIAQGGMNFGNIAIYTCSKACDASDSALAVVQESVDDCELPVDYKPSASMAQAHDPFAPVVIDENAQFDVDEDFGDEDDGDYGDDFDDDCDDDDDDDEDMEYSCA